MLLYFYAKEEGKYKIMEGFSFLTEFCGGVIGYFASIPLDGVKNVVSNKIRKFVFEYNIKKRANYLNSKIFKDEFDSQREVLKNQNMIKWLCEQSTIKRLISFSSISDAKNINAEQLVFFKQQFFLDAYKMADAERPSEKENIKLFLTELIEYINQLFWKTINEKQGFLLKKSCESIFNFIRQSNAELIEQIKYIGTFAEYIDLQKAQQKTDFVLDYRSESIPFTGRETEFKELDKFREADKQVLWWAIIADGGSGKSRLAYEYILKNENMTNWKMLFLKEEFFRQENSGGKYQNFQNWTYSKNLFLVIDYVQKYAKESAQWIESLLSNKSVSSKIRILILERTGEENSLWYREIFDTFRLKSCRFDDFLKLRPLNEEKYIELAMEYTKKMKRKFELEQAREALKHLEEIDRQKRILYYILIIDAILSDESWRKWSRTDLAEFIVKREIKIIKERFKKECTGILPEYKKVLAFCTATKQISLKNIQDNLQGNILQYVNIIKNKCQDIEQLMGLIQSKSITINPMTPDIVGEFYVLHVLCIYYIDNKKVNDFIQEAWNFAPEDFMVFIYRIIQDKLWGSEELPDFDRVVSEMLEEPETSSEEVLVAYCTLLRVLIAIESPISGNECLKRIEKVYKDNEKKSIGLEYAQGLFNLSCDQELEGREESIGKLQTLSEKNPSDEGVRLIYAQGLVILSNAQRLEGIEESIEKLKELSEKNPLDEGVRLEYAKGLVNLSNAQELEGIEESIGKLQALSEKNPSDEGVRMLYAQGLVNLSYYQEAEGSEESIEKLKELSEKNQSDEGVRLEYAKGLFNLSCAQELKGRAESIGKLQALSEKNPLDEGVRLLYAQGLFNLSCDQELEGRWESIGKLQALSEKKPSDEGVRLIYAKGLFNLSNAQKLEGREESIEKLKALSEKNPSDEGVRLSYAQGLVNLSCVQEQEGIEESIGKLKELREKNPSDEGMRLEYAKGLVNLSCAQELDGIEESIGKLKELSEKNPSDEGIRLLYDVAQNIFEI